MKHRCSFKNAMSQKQISKKISNLVTINVKQQQIETTANTLHLRVRDSLILNTLFICTMVAGGT